MFGCVSHYLWLCESSSVVVWAIICGCVSHYLWLCRLCLWICHLYLLLSQLYLQMSVVNMSVISVDMSFITVDISVTSMDISVTSFTFSDKSHLRNHAGLRFPTHKTSLSLKNLNFSQSPYWQRPLLSTCRLQYSADMRWYLMAEATDRYQTVIGLIPPTLLIDH